MHVDTEGMFCAGDASLYACIARALMLSKEAAVMSLAVMFLAATPAQTRVVTWINACPKSMPLYAAAGLP